MGMSSGNAGDLSRARVFGAAGEPLTDPSRSLQSNPRERGPGSQGAGPLAEYEAAPHARLSAPLPGGLDHLRVVQTVASLSFRTSRSTSSASHPHLHWSVARPASIRILAAFLGAACKIRSFESGRGAAISATASYGNQDAERSRPETRHIKPIEIRLFGQPGDRSSYCFPVYATALAAGPLSFLSGSYLAPVTHNRCSSTANFRATAAAASFRAPFLSFRSAARTMANPHRLRSLSSPNGPRMWCAQFTSSFRTNSSPALVIPNRGSLLPDCRFFGINPKYGPTSRLCSKRSLSSSVST